MSQLQNTPGQRYNDCFATLKEKNEGAFIPFVMIGDPNAEQSFEVIKTLIDAGADVSATTKDGQTAKDIALDDKTAACFE